MPYRYRFPAEVIERDGPFKELKQDGAIVSVELDDGTIFGTVLLVYPDFIGGMPSVDSLPFAPSAVKRIYQTDENLKTRSSSDWTSFLETSAKDA